jgi:hypothetical protein
MGSVKTYRGHAAECVRFAQQTTNPGDKALLLKMADSWMRLAERAEARAAFDGCEEAEEEAS